jgi:hypothetical protein
MKGNIKQRVTVFKQVIYILGTPLTFKIFTDN